MKTFIRILMFMVGLFFMTLVMVVAQETNTPPIGTEPGEPTVVWPTGAAVWLALIPPATFTITWLLGKIPALPNAILPWLTPLVGILIGMGLDAANKADLPTGLAAALGTVAVALYEGIKQLTKRSEGAMRALTPTGSSDNPNTTTTPTGTHGQV
jgi:hypothetical protein